MVLAEEEVEVEDRQAVVPVQVQDLVQALVQARRVDPLEEAVAAEMQGKYLGFRLPDKFLTQFTVHRLLHAHLMVAANTMAEVPRHHIEPEQHHQLLASRRMPWQELW